jgi:hypothetical protein
MKIESEVGCRVKWVPAAADLYNILPDSFSLEYTFCNTKAQAIHWHMGSMFFTGQEFSAVGLLSPDNNTVLQGATSNTIELSIQPTLFIGTTHVYESAPSSKTRGYSGYLLEATPGYVRYISVYKLHSFVSLMFLFVLRIVLKQMQTSIFLHAIPHQMYQ